MSESIVANKKSRGRPSRPNGVDPVSAVGLPLDVTAKVDAWAERHEVSRPEAIRRLVEIGLRTKSK